MARECGQFIGNGTVNYPCIIDAGHEGPHQANELPRTKHERDLWLNDRQEWERRYSKPPVTASTALASEQAAEARHQASGLAQFQGRAETTAQRYTENPTPVPKTREQIDEERQAEVARQFTESTLPRQPAVEFEPVPPAPGVYSPDQPVQPPMTRPDPNHPGVPDVPETKPLNPYRDGEGRSLDMAEPSKQRPEDQPLPTVSDRAFIQDLVIADIQARKAVGIARYGTPLQPLNGRDTLLDAYEESVDQTTYLRSVLEERRLALGATEVIEGFLRAGGSRMQNHEGTIYLPPEIEDAISILRQVLQA